jgi:quercetin dioxygenase-like cupin family protein
MNLKNLHLAGRSVSALSIFKGEGSVVSLKISAGESLKEHITKVPACMICISGEAVFKNEQLLKIILHPGDYIMIEPSVKHHVTANIDSQLILMK